MEYCPKQFNLGHFSKRSQDTVVNVKPHKNTKECVIAFLTTAKCRPKMISRQKLMDKINTEAHSPCIKFKMTSAEQNTVSLLEPVFTWFCLLVNQSPDFFTSVSNLVPRGPF